MVVLWSISFPIISPTLSLISTIVEEVLSAEESLIARETNSHNIAIWGSSFLINPPESILSKMLVFSKSIIVIFQFYVLVPGKVQCIRLP